MKKFLKKNWKVFGLPIRFFAKLAFDKRYLTGRYFDNNLGGWYWAIKGVWQQKILGFNRNIPWPVSHTTKISNPNRIKFHNDDMNNFQSPGTYFQNMTADITIGHGTYIGPNVGLITANHDPLDLSNHLEGLPIVIGKNCWLGMNSIILPGVKLGDNTIVGAGAIVTKSFPNGQVVLAGNPARILKK